MRNIGPLELLIILGIILLILGPAKLPQLARGLGRSLSEFRRAAREEGDDEAGERGRASQG